MGCLPESDSPYPIDFSRSYVLITPEKTYDPNNYKPSYKNNKRKHHKK